MIKNNLSLIEIRKLSTMDLENLITIWNEDPEEYNKYFIPFEMKYEYLKEILDKSIRDLYMVICLDNNIAGFFMLRGFDEGFTIPSYGVWISSKYSNKGLAKLSLFYCISICKISGVKRIMLKVHPDNKVALKIYKELGFYKSGFDNKIGNIIMHKDLN